MPGNLKGGLLYADRAAQAYRAEFHKPRAGCFWIRTHIGRVFTEMLYTLEYIYGLFTALVAS